MTAKLYPFTLHAADRHYVSNPKLAERLWIRDRSKVAPKLTWYGLDMEVISWDAVEIHVREMRDCFYGGIGKVVFKYRPELTGADLAELSELVKQRQLLLAAEEHCRREERRIADEIETIRRELFD